MPQTEHFIPREPESLEKTGLGESLVEQLIMKILYYRGELYGQELSAAIGLRFSVIEDLVESLKVRHHIQVKKSLGMGAVGSMLALTESGRARAREHLETNQYAGPAPVPMDQYADAVRQQRPRDGWLTKDTLVKAFRALVVTERVISQVGPAVSSGNSMLIYGKPGDGKTFLIEALGNLDTAPIFLPYALECQGNIVQIYDPIYHHRVAEEQASVMAVAVNRSSYDRRYARCKRPFIVSGGELTLDMLDLRYNHTSKVYEAPFQLKANNGIYLIDDFGRQRATPVEVLNRWIVPMERRVDYMSFLTGGKMTSPFEAFLVFSTNLNPASLGDEAFLRRIQYKMLLRGPAENEFIRIFETFCAARSLACPRDMIVRFIDRHYRHSKKPFRRCHPRDVLWHALNLMHFERLPVVLTDAILDRAFESCFVQEDEDAPPVSAELMPTVLQTCPVFWADRISKAQTRFGGVALAASLYNPGNGHYEEGESNRQFGDLETDRTLASMHQKLFQDWLSMPREQQNLDLSAFTISNEAALIKLSMDRQELVRRLAPPTAKPEDIDLFAYVLSMVLDRPAATQESAAAAPVVG